MRLSFSWIYLFFHLLTVHFFFLLCTLFGQYGNLERLMDYLRIKPGKVPPTWYPSKYPKIAFCKPQFNFQAFKLFPNWLLFVRKQTVSSCLFIWLSHSVCLSASLVHFIHQQGNHSVSLFYFLMLSLILTFPQHLFQKESGECLCYHGASCLFKLNKAFFLI